MLQKKSSKALNSAVVYFIAAAILLTPIMGVILDDYNIILNIQLPLFISLVIGLLRFSYLTLEYKNKLSMPNIIRNLNIKLQTNNVNLLCKTEKYHIHILLFISILLPLLLSKYWLSVLILALIYVLLGVGLNIVVGYAGLLDLGYVGFYAIGAYTYALGTQYFDLSFWAALPIGALFAGIAGAILAFPVLRMHGDYLAIVTLGFGEIIRLILNNWISLTNGPNGVVTPQITIFGLEFNRISKNGGVPFHDFFHIAYSSKLKYLIIYFVLLVVVSITVKFSHKLKNMPIGRAWEALRENEIACRSLGIYHVTTKLSAFSIGAAIAGIGGVFFAAFQGFVNPSSFTFFESALILAIVVLGGMGSLLGVILAALVLTTLPELLRDFSELRMLTFGFLMIIMMMFKPNGFIKLKRPIINLNER